MVCPALIVVWYTTVYGLPIHWRRVCRCGMVYHAGNTTRLASLLLTCHPLLLLTRKGTSGFPHIIK